MSLSFHSVLVPSSGLKPGCLNPKGTSAILSLNAFNFTNDLGVGWYCTTILSRVSIPWDLLTISYSNDSLNTFLPVSLNSLGEPRERIWILVIRWTNFPVGVISLGFNRLIYPNKNPKSVQYAPPRECPQQTRRKGSVELCSVTARIKISHAAMRTRVKEWLIFTLSCTGFTKENPRDFITLPRLILPNWDFKSCISSFGVFVPLKHIITSEGLKGRSVFSKMPLDTLVLITKAVRCFRVEINVPYFGWERGGAGPRAYDSFGVPGIGVGWLDIGVDLCFSYNWSSDLRRVITTEFSFPKSVSNNFLRIPLSQ